MTTGTQRKEEYATEIARLFPRRGEWSEEDYFALPESNQIVELSNGEIIMPPPPGEPHQKASLELVTRLVNYVTAHDLGIVRYAPVAVRLWEGKIREPDVIFFRKEHADRIKGTYYEPPDLAVEIISPGSRKTDEVDKLAEYAQAGIPEYWLVDLEKKMLRVNLLREGETVYHLAATYTAGQVARSETISGFEIEVGVLLP